MLFDHDHTCSVEELNEYCESNREADRFCSVNCSCSGWSYSNLQPDFDYNTTTGYPCRGKCGFLGNLEA